jgi:hypothetical protein
VGFAMRRLFSSMVVGLMTTTVLVSHGYAQSGSSQAEIAELELEVSVNTEVEGIPLGQAVTTFNPLTGQPVTYYKPAELAYGTTVTARSWHFVSYKNLGSVPPLVLPRVNSSATLSGNVLLGPSSQLSLGTASGGATNWIPANVVLQQGQSAVVWTDGLSMTPYTPAPWTNSSPKITAVASTQNTVYYNRVNPDTTVTPTSKTVEKSASRSAIWKPQTN